MAALLGDRAPLCERAPGRQCGRVRWGAGDGCKGAPAADVVDPGHRAQQGGRVGVARPGEDLRHAALLDRAARVHHDHVRAEFGDDAHVVGDDRDGDAEFAAEPVEQAEDLRLDGDVKGGGGLVGDEEGGVVGERDGDDDALAHPAGELVRIVVDLGVDVGDAYGLEEFARPLPGLRAAVAVRRHRLDDLLADPHRRIEGGLRILEDHGDLAAAPRTHLALGKGEQVGAAVTDAARGDFAGDAQHPHHRAGGDGLAGAGFADDAEHLPRPNLEAHVVDGSDRAAGHPELGTQPVDTEQRFRLRRRGLRPGGFLGRAHFRFTASLNASDSRLKATASRSSSSAGPTT